MKQPTTAGGILELHQILRKNPQQYLRIVSEWIQQDPRNSNAYYDRHLAWMKLGDPRRAIEDLSKTIELGPD